MDKVVGVVGLGTMGQGIAEVVARAGYTVLAVDRDESLVRRGIEAIRKSLARAAEKGRMSPGEAEETAARVVAVQDFEDLGRSFLVIEAVYEDLSVKKEVFERIGRCVSPGTLIATNTSALSISELAASVPDPGRFIGIHFFNPVPVMKLVEIVMGENTRPETLERAVEFVTQLGKEPVVVRESPGFVVNRILCPMMNEASYLVYEGVASPEDVDKAMKMGANHPIGPLALADLVGIDVLLSIMKTLEGKLGPKYRPCPLLEEMVREGKLGRKTGQGFFSYPGRDR